MTAFTTTPHHAQNSHHRRCRAVAVPPSPHHNVMLSNATLYHRARNKAKINVVTHFVVYHRRGCFCRRHAAPPSTLLVIAPCWAKFTPRWVNYAKTAAALTITQVDYDSDTSVDSLCKLVPLSGLVPSSTMTSKTRAIVAVVAVVAELHRKKKIEE